MIFIDYSLPWYSRYILFLDAPFRYCSRHLLFYFQAKSIRKHTSVSILSKREKVTHFCIAFLEVIPIFGHLIACFDWLLFRRPLRLIRLKTLTANERAKNITEECCFELYFMLEKVLPLYRAILTYRGKKPYEEARKIEKYIPERFINEMQALSAASNIPYVEILLANTVIDMLDLFGSSICALSKNQETGQKSREFATNHFPSKGRGHNSIDIDHSFRRYDTVLASQPTLSTNSLLQMLRKVNCKDTIHTVIADVNKRELSIAIGSDHVANRQPKRYSAQVLFGDAHMIQGDCQAMLARNLEWPLAFFSPLTRLFVRERNGQYHATALINCPGLLGGYSGMNEYGLSFAASVVPAKTQEGIPNQLLFRQIIEEAKSIREALKILEKSRPACSMNLILAASDGIVHAELDPSRKKVGAALLTFGS